MLKGMYCIKCKAATNACFGSFSVMYNLIFSFDNKTHNNKSLNCIKKTAVFMENPTREIWVKPPFCFYGKNVRVYRMVTLLQNIIT